MDEARLAVSVSAAHPQLVVFSHKGGVTPATSHHLHFSFELDFLRNGRRVPIVVSQLAKAPSTPSVDIAVLVYVSGMVFSRSHIHHLLEERLNSSWKAEFDGVKASDSQLTVPVVSKRVQPSIRVHDNGVVRSTDYFLHFNSEIQLLRRVVVTEIVMPELPFPAFSPGKQLSVFGDAGGMLESTSDLFYLLGLTFIHYLEETELCFGLYFSWGVGASYSVLVLTDSHASW